LPRPERKTEVLERVGKIGFLSFDLESEKVEWSPGLYSIFGIPGTEPAPSMQRFFEYVQPGDRESIESAFRKAVEEYVPFSIWISAKNMDAANLTLSCKGDFENDETGRPVSLVSVVHDMTDYGDKIASLEETEIKYRTLVEHSPDAVALHCEGKIVYVNRAGLLLAGVDDERMLLGKTIESFIPEDSMEDVRERRRQVESGNVVPFVERKVIRPDGKILDIEAAQIPYNYRGKPGGQVVIRDISERKKIERRLLDNEKLLKRQYRMLEEKNIALRELMTQIVLEKENMEMRVNSNVDTLVLPLLARLKEKGSPVTKDDLYLLEENLKKITEEFGMKISGRMLGLTRREIEICNLIRSSMSTKQVADFLNIAPRTVETHRNNIRKKFGIRKNVVNLTTFLNSLDK